MNKQDIVLKINRFGLKCKKHSPEILLVVGIATGVAGVVTACIASTKVKEVTDDHKERVTPIKEHYEDRALIEGSESKALIKEQRKELAKQYGTTAIAMTKLYLPSAILLITSGASILASHGIIQKRYVALAATYALTDKHFKDYRKRVINEYGQEVDDKMFYGVEKVIVEETVTDDKGKEKKVKKEIEMINPDNISSPTTFIFDADHVQGWNHDEEHALTMLNMAESYFNNLIEATGYVFLNDILDHIGLPRTKEGQLLGWIYDSEEVHPIDFGIRESNIEDLADIVSGYKTSIILNFNVQGNILNMI